MKSLIIKLFRLNEISSVIDDARKKQSVIEKKLYDAKVYEIEAAHRREMALLAQDKDAEISLLTSTIENMRRREKAIDDIEYRSKVQIKENFRIATEISMHLNDFVVSLNKIQGEVQGVASKAQSHNKKLSDR